MKLILPKNYVDLTFESFYARTPLYFLSGPVQGGGDWQRKILPLIKHHEEHCLVASPCRYGNDDDIRRDHVWPFTEGVFARQTDWERHYLNRASHKGCILFWLGCEDKDNPRTDGSPYARDTYGELGEWRGRLMQSPRLHVVVGAESDFPGLSVISRNFNDALGQEFPIYSTMEETVKAAVRKSYE